nr:unnamed protein product [Haemonchus contortus]
MKAQTISQSAGKLIPDREITEALNVLVSLDERLDGHAKINYQNMASRKDFTHDNAKEPLFTSVAQRALNGATYKAFKNLISFYNEPDVDVPETVTSDWEAAIDSFLDAVTNTTVMRSTKEFLTSKGVVSDDESFRNLLYTMWFTQYARGHAVGSSGFESVFSGEIRGNDVIRFNNWFRFYELETAGQVNYHGWYTREKNIEMSLQFEWNNWKAMDTSMLLNTSPEFEMAVYTICALGKGQCKMNIGRVQVQIFAKTIKQNDIVLIDHCYPGAASPAPSPAPTRRPTEKTRRPRPTEKPEPTGWPTERTRRPRPTEKPHGSDFQVSSNEISILPLGKVNFM